MDKIKRFIDCYIPVTTCSLRCHYCYITHHRLFEGKLPELKTPTYAELRNRKCKDGTEWLRQEMKAFMQTKLYECNAEYTPWQKIKANYEIRKIAYRQNYERNEQ